jgi:flavin-binding protein dodecin
MRMHYEGQSNGGYRQDRQRDMDEERMMMRRGRGRDTVGHGQLVKVIEVLAESDRSWEDAAERAVMEASKTVRNIKSVYVKDMQAIVRDGRIVSWRLNAKVSFALEQRDRFEETY